MVVLVAEATGVGYGLGQIISMARNTFNPRLVFFTIVIIGLLGFTFDFALRLLQRRVLFWLPKGQGGPGLGWCGAGERRAQRGQLHPRRQGVGTWNRAGP